MSAYFPHIARSVLQEILLWLFLTGIPAGIAAQQVQEVGGLLEENTVWTDEYIYLVTDDLIVSPGISLEIGPGVTVKFNQGRGMIVENGILKVNGTQADSVMFLPNHSGNEDWNWKGIGINAVSETGNISVRFAKIYKAIIGIAVNASRGIEVENTAIIENLNIGVSLTNSLECRISNGVFADNFLGVEIFSTDPGNSSTENLIDQNWFRGHTTAILVHNSNNGVCRENTIEQNLIQEGLHAIWLYNSAADGAGNVRVSRNIIFENGNESDGYGVYVSADSALISHNIFWRNHQAVSFRQARNCTLKNNSIVDNSYGIDDRNNATGQYITQNTFTLNDKTIITFSESEDLVIEANNWFANDQTSNIVRTQIPENIDISGNYWGTADPPEIDKLIFDKKDNPALGHLYYEPFLDSADLSAPVSPPMGALVQKTGDSLVLRWKSGRESDLAGYRVHYGEFRHYRFLFSSDLITDTSFVLDNQYWGHPIGITALDKDAQGESAQLDGNESPFAFALPLPYAGENMTLCKTEPAVQITGSTVPVDFDSLLWISDGDGAFDDASLLWPVYIFGENDLENMEVLLTLEVAIADTTLSDQVKISLTDPPEVTAGEDAVIAPDSIYNTSGALASGFDTLIWQSTGDGTFDDPGALITAYFPGVFDKAAGNVGLILSAQNTACGTVSDTLHLLIKDRFMAEGKVWQQEMPVTDAPVVAISLNGNTGEQVRAITFTDAEGRFRFNGLFTGAYLFYAIADTAIESVVLPAYYLNKNAWEEAYAVQLSGDVSGMDIHLSGIENSLPEGIGEISGNFAYPVGEGEDLEIFCRPWFGDEGVQYCEEGLSNVTVLLYGESGSKIFNYTLTDENGDFSFRKLPFGTYFLKVEIAGYQSPISEMIVLTPANSSYDNIRLFIEPERKVGIFIPNKENAKPEFNTFPNPATSRLLLSLPVDKFGFQLNVEVFNIRGEMVRQFSGLSVGQHTGLDVMTLKSGIYFGRATYGGNIHTFKFVKK